MSEKLSACVNTSGTVMGTHKYLSFDLTSAIGIREIGNGEKYADSFEYFYVEIEAAVIMNYIEIEILGLIYNNIYNTNL